MIHEAFNQVGVQPQVGLSFARRCGTSCARTRTSWMVGEIRDVETAENASRRRSPGTSCSRRAHQRRADRGSRASRTWGLPLLSGRRSSWWWHSGCCAASCRHCGRGYEPDADELASLGVRPPAARCGCGAAGCAQCRFTGHHGRRGSSRLMPVSPALRALIQRRPGQGEIWLRRARRGSELREAGVQQCSAASRPSRRCRGHDARRGVEGQRRQAILARP